MKKHSRRERLIQTRKGVSKAAENSSQSDPLLPERPRLTRRRSKVSNSFKVVLTVHEETSTSITSDKMPGFILNPQAFPGIRLHDTISIVAASSSDRISIGPLYLQVEQLQEVKGSFQISLSKVIADKFGLHNRSDVLVNVVPPEVAFVDYVELAFKGQYISRGDMWRMKEHLVSKTAFQSEILDIMGMHAQVNEVMLNNTSVASGVISKKTKLVFRSKSARLIWMIQISDELWDCADDGELYFEKIINGLVKCIFDQWKSSSVNHSITIVLFTRTIFSMSSEHSSPWSSELGTKKPTSASRIFQSDHQNRLYQDFYEVVLDAEPVSTLSRDWREVRRSLKRDIHKFSKNVKWNRYDKSTGLIGNPSTATNGNMLEAINLALNCFDKHYIDRDLSRTGLGIVVFTAGNGVLFVDEELANLTSARMVDNGVGFDIISVAKRPIHAVPLFIYKQKSFGDEPNPGPARIEVPREWLVMKYFDYQDYVDTPLSSNLWFMKNCQDGFYPIPLCRMFPNEDFVNTVPENQFIRSFHDVSSTFLTSKDLSRPGFLREYDEKVFTSRKTREPQSRFEVPEVFKKVTVESEGSSPMSASPHDSRIGLHQSPEHPSLESMGSPFELSKSLSPSKAVSSGDLAKWNDLQKRRSKLEERRNPLEDEVKAEDSDSSDEERDLLSQKDSLIDVDDERWHPKGKVESVPSSRRLKRAFNIESEKHTSIVVESTDIAVQAYSTPQFDEGINPFKLILKPLDPSSSRRRWTHLLPTTIDAFHDDSEELNIKSLTIPAVLPLTCDFFPIDSDRSSKFVNYVHTVSLAFSNNRFEDRIDLLLKEIIAQRLTQDYQLVLSTSAVDSSDSILGTLSQIRYRLSMADECHEIDYDHISGNIEIKRYVRAGRTKKSKHYSISFPYRYFLWSEHLGRFYSQDITISSHHHDYNWNFVDQLISRNADDPLISGIKYRSNQFVVIPSNREDKHDFEARELSRFKQFVEFITKRSFDALGIDISSLENTEDIELIRSLYDGTRDFPDSIPLGTDTTFVRVDLESVFKERQEWLDVSYDSTFHPGICFHFAIRWMVASGFIVKQFIKKLFTQAASLGLNLVQIPQQISYRNCYPFHPMLHVPLADPRLINIAEVKFISSFQFYLARRKSKEKREYVHVSGLASLRVLDDGFLWVNNNLPSAKALRSRSSQVFHQLLRYCESLNRIHKYVQSLVDKSMSL